ncbi:restriction endonuclease subunit S [Histophilus somni]|uniref:restriction endonuclease subunit S n=2 Tax=Histophilus somni TaxID=731 RepID=UPI0010724062|nr:restriction endonuclease subunit S [Histophilus somni]TFI33686.1 restriction endonuclease subunit S [Histophilus somni]
MNNEKRLVPKLRFPEFTHAWEQRKLGEVVEIIMGQSPNSENYTNNPKDHILVQGNADIKNGKVFPRTWTTQITKIGKKNDLVMSVRAPVGDMAKTDYDVVLGRGVCAIRGNEFIFQLLNKMKINGYWNTLSTGSTFESINSNDIKNAQISIPLPIEQQKISTFFTALDRYITIHQRKLENIQKLKKSLLQKMFPKNDQEFPEIRFPEFTYAWEQLPFKKLANIRRGLTYKPTDLAETGIRVLRSSNINEDIFLLQNDDVFVDPKTVNIPLVQENEILITSANGSSRLVGKHALIKGATNSVAGGFMLVAQAKNPSFVNSLMNSTWYSKFISTYVAGGNGAIGNLSKQDLEEQLVQVPSKQEQQKIGTFFTALDRYITIHQRKLENMQKLKKSLLQQMFV